MAFECHPATTPSIGAVSGVWRGRMPGGLKPDSHRVSMWVLSCVMDFPVSDAPRNTAGAALQNTSAAVLVFDADRATGESSARNTAGAANSAGAALVLNAVRATHEPSARKQGASAMNGRRGSGRAGCEKRSFAARSVGAGVKRANLYKGDHSQKVIQRTHLHASEAQVKSK